MDRKLCAHCARAIAAQEDNMDRWRHVSTGRESCGDYDGTWAYPAPQQQAAWLAAVAAYFGIEVAR